MKRWRSLALVAALVVHTLAAPARADVPAAPIAGALYTPAVADGGAVTWYARWILTQETVTALLDGPMELRFAVPLPAGETLAPRRGVEPVLEDGRLVAVRLTAGALDLRESGYRSDVSAVFTQREPRGTLGAPFVAGDAVQILDAAPQGGARLELEPRQPFVRRVGYVAPDAVGHAARQGARDVTWFYGGMKHFALYARGDDVRAAGGIDGKALSARDVSARAVLPIAAVFAVLVGGLVVAMRRLRRAASAERADAILALEIDEAGAP
jgi:hypothetical protein